MKNLLKVLALSLIVGLFGVVSISSLLASSTVQVPYMSINFSGENGIRWNSGLAVFEVFNAVGVSYIGSGTTVNANGDLGGEGADFEATSPEARYHIMQDINYSSDLPINQNYVTNKQRFSIAQGGLVDGRGFTLKNFPIVSDNQDQNCTSLFLSNEGTIQNINILDPVFITGANPTGILCQTNIGTIENCTVSGTILNSSKTGEQSFSSSAICLAAIAYKGAGTIRNCTNRLNITTQGAKVAGILVGDENETGEIFGCNNFGNLQSTTASGIAGGIIAHAKGGGVLSSQNHGQITANAAGGIIGTKTGTVAIKDNRNYSTIQGVGTSNVAGILGGPEYQADTTNITSNYNYGQTTGTNKANIYIGEPKQSTGGTSGGAIGIGGDIGSGTLEDPYKPLVVGSNGIYYFEEVDVFLVDKEFGLNYIGNENYYFDSLGIRYKTDGEGRAKPSSDKKFYLANSIAYTGVSNLSYNLIGNGVFDGQGFEISNLPIKQQSTGYSALFGTVGANAVVRNLRVTVAATASSGNTGIMTYENNGTIENCSVVLSGITGSNNVGGLCYVNNGTIIDCNSTISGAMGSNGVGGIAYSNSGTINDCSTEINPLPAVISENCKFSVPGGFSFYGVVIFGCYNLASVGVNYTARYPEDEFVCVGGVIGRTEINLGGISVIFCGNGIEQSGSSNIYVNMSISGSYYDVEFYYPRVGGLIGVASLGNSTVLNIYGYNNMKITGNSNKVHTGGMFGWLQGPSSAKVVKMGPCYTNANDITNKGGSYVATPFSIGYLSTSKPTFDPSNGSSKYPVLDSLDIWYTE